MLTQKQVTLRRIERGHRDLDVALSRGLPISDAVTEIKRAEAFGRFLEIPSEDVRAAGVKGTMRGLAIFNRIEG